jgi:amino acid transporter
MNGKVDEVMDGITDQPVINVFQVAFTNSEGERNLSGALAMSILLLINVYLGGFSHLTVTTRIVFAMTRDGAFPGSKYIYGVDKKRKIPVKSIIFCFFVDSIICLLPLINDQVFSAVCSISTIGYSISYAMPIFLRITVSRNTFRRGPYHLGKSSLIIGWISATFLVITSVAFFFATSFDENLN